MGFNSGFKGLKRFSCNGAVDWSTTCFCCESVLQKTVTILCLLSVNFEESLGFIAIVLFHQPMSSTWVRNFEATGSTLKKKGGDVKTVCTPENIAVVREAIEKSPHCSERRHSVSLRLSEASVRCILHKDLHFCPYKKGLDGMG